MRRHEVAVQTRRGSGNVFRDLGFDASKAANLQLRSTLMIHLRKRLDALTSTQAESASLLGVSQPRVSDLMRGKIDRFSVDTLIALLERTGAEVRVTVRARRKAA
jgi:predicted XRE-type DNA-binding protein